MKQAKFPKGVPADPTKNMSAEQAAEWDAMNEKYKDLLKTARAASKLSPHQEEALAKAWMLMVDAYREEKKTWGAEAADQYRENGIPFIGAQITKSRGTVDALLKRGLLKVFMSHDFKYETKTMWGRGLPRQHSQRITHYVLTDKGKELGKRLAQSPRTGHTREASVGRPVRASIQGPTYEVLALLLSLLRAQHWLFWTGHWQVQGQSFYGDHLLMERLYGEEIQAEIDTLAEKMVGRFGPEAVHPSIQFQLTGYWVNEVSGITCPIHRGMATEEFFETLLEEVYDVLDEEETLSFGMDDFLAATASRHETALYLLKQRLPSLWAPR